MSARRTSIVRASLLVVLLVALVGLFVLAGAGWPSDPSPGISAEDIAQNVDAHVGEEIETSGEVIDPEAGIIAIELDERIHEPDPTVTIVDGHLLIEVGPLPPEARIGDQLIFVGEIQPDGSIAIDVDRAIVRAPWEVQYMYIISLIGLFIVALVGVNFWRFDRRHLTVEPRSNALHTKLIHGGTDG